MNPYTLSALVCAIAIAGIYRIDAQDGTRQNEVSSTGNNHNTQEVTDDASSNEGLQGSNDGSDQRPRVTCKIGETSMKSCQNLAGKTVNNLNEQIEMNLIAAYDYDAMSLFFARDDVAYRGFAKYFEDLSGEKREQAEELKEYIVERGGRWMLKTIPRRTSEWQNPLYSLTEALLLERRINKRLLQIHDEAVEKNDPHLQNFLEAKLINQQVSTIRQLSGWSSIMSKLEDDVLGWTVFDEEIAKGKRGRNCEHNY